MTIVTGATLLNQTIGNYKVTRLLGEGGMGAVYLAEHPVIGRKVAIKLLHSTLSREPDLVGRFFNEARAIHMISHENIVEILDFGQTPDGQPYFIMEYLEGEPLSDAILRGPMPPEKVEAIGIQMCRALAAAHAKGIVHRDLKPHNVYLTSTATGEVHVKLLDFGVAKILATPDDAQLVKTRTGSLMGTPLYMSPEQCKGAGVLDHRTDIYSLGVMLFEMLAGQPPFTAEGVGELFAKHMLEEPPLVTTLAPKTPPHLAAAIMRALAKEPAARFASMEEFRQALSGEMKVSLPVPRSLQDSSAARFGTDRTMLSDARPDPSDEETIPRQSRRWLWGVGGAMVLAIVAVVMTAMKPDESKRAASPALPAQTSPAAGPRTAPAATSPTAGTGTGPAVAGASSTGAAGPPSKRTVTLRFEAEPAGAHVYRQTDDKDLGPAPVQLELPRELKAGQGASYVFRMSGYRDLAVVADATADRTLRVQLDKLPPAPATADRKRGTAGARRPAKRNPLDEDGLATPSF